MEISINIFCLLLFLLTLQFCMTQNVVHAKVHVRVVNQLGNGQSMILHCRSRDDDLGNVVLEDGKEMEWSFSVNFLGTTLFYCDVRWGLSSSTSSNWYSFDAYDEGRDYARCRSECRWRVSNERSLYGYDQRCERWVLFPLTRK
ncbi:Self-incompatibility protein [Parasponia andersonii]|uniref:S-protein homolog n=1 Tax=Parasponia andersonii TaxID=3476 RepID=A0A2P5D7D5_PARAD|nr:Self-incompatibility protein [Parasponia andersonii]